MKNSKRLLIYDLTFLKWKEKMSQTVILKNKKKFKKMLITRCETSVGQNTTGFVAVESACVCKHGSVKTPYLGIALLPLLGVLLVLL